MSFDEFSVEHADNYHGGRWNRLIPLSHTHPAYVEVESIFRQGWKHPHKPLPQVRSVFKVVFPDSKLKPYVEYRSLVDASLNLKGKKSPGNETLLFHGTTRTCLLGERSKNGRLCDSMECSLCCIVRQSFDVKMCGSKNKFRRFGTGIYITGCSSKADDYVCNISEKASLRAMLVNRVVVGKPLLRRFNATNLSEPPCGHHSVIGEPGNDLKYQETVVYNNNAIRPAYLVVYGDAPHELDLKLRAIIKKLFSTPLLL